MDAPLQKAAQLEGYLSNVSNTPWVKAVDRTDTPFAVRLSGPDPEDRKWNLVGELVEKGKVKGTEMTAIAPNEWYSYMARKLDRQLLANYEGWAINQIDLSSPEKAEFWSKVVPWVREKREALLEEQAAIQKQIALIRIRGIQSEDDMKLLFAIQNKLINIAKVPLYDIDNIANAGQIQGQVPDGVFTSGLLNPFSTFFLPVKGDGLHVAPGNKIPQIQLQNPVDAFANAGNTVIPAGYKRPGLF